MCTVRVTVVVVCVGLSVCESFSLSVFQSVSQSVSQTVTPYLTPRTINHSTNNTTYSVSDKGRKICRVFIETAAFESYGVKHEQKSHMQITTGLPRPHSACSSTVEATEVTTESECTQTSVPRVCTSVLELLILFGACCLQKSPVLCIIRPV